jgi:diguanylate cyclase (GGDEF)-like protein/PAS domain S-box-containing protein
LGARSADVQSARRDGPADSLRRAPAQPGVRELAAIVESSDDAIYSVDLDDIVTTWNAGAERLLGFSAGEIVGSSARMLLPPGREREMERCIASILRGERLERFDTVRARKDGASVDVAIVISPIHDDDGELVAASVIARDITQRIASQRELRASLAALHHVNTQLYRKTRALSTLSASVQALVRAAEETQLLQAVCDVAVLEGGFRMARVGYCQSDAGKSVTPVVAAGEDGGYHNEIKASWDDVPNGRGPIGRAIRECRPVVVDDVANDPHFKPWREAALDAGYRSVIGLPLIGEDHVAFGALTIYAAEVEAFDAEEVRLLEQLALDLSYGVTSLRNRVKRDAAEQLVREMAYVDSLTGLPNRRLLDDRAAMALAHARRSRGSVAAVFVDVDRLKAVNDELGHACGDEVIREAARRLSGALRDGDTVARLGGDEFVAILLDCDETGAELIAQRILEAVAEPMSISGHTVCVTASAGIAVGTGTLDAVTLFRQADDAMYCVKRAGGNGLRIHAEE